MSIVKHIEVRCDLCHRRFPWSQESVANRAGNTKGCGTADARKEAKVAGWLRGKTRLGHQIDICDRCEVESIPDLVWFERDDWGE